MKKVVQFKLNGKPVELDVDVTRKLLYKSVSRAAAASQPSNTKVQNPASPFMVSRQSQ